MPRTFHTCSINADAISPTKTAASPVASQRSRNGSTAQSVSESVLTEHFCEKFGPRDITVQKAAMLFDECGRLTVATDREVVVSTDNGLYNITPRAAMQFPMLNHIWPKDAVEPWPSDFRARCHEFRAFALTCFRCQLLPPELLMVLAEFTFLFAEPIRLAEVKAAVVPYIIRYQEYHKDVRPTQLGKPLQGSIKDHLDHWDRKFIFTDLIQNGQDNQHQLLVDMMIAAHNLGMKDLLEFSCFAVASVIKEKSNEQLRTLFSAHRQASS
jgi:hypothetical protein